MSQSDPSRHYSAPMSKLLAIPSALFPLFLCACQVVRPSELPKDVPWLVAVKSAGLPAFMPWYSRFAEHTWIDIKCGSEEQWKRAEVLGRSKGATFVKITSTEARRDWRWEEPVRIQEVIVGGSAQRIAEKISQVVNNWDPFYKGQYLAWPGPNSNTFIRDLVNELPELAVTFDHNALGKDYTWASAGLTPSRTGVHLDTWPMGVSAGLREGIELHLLQLTLGVNIWPPRLKLPFLPTIPWDSAPQRSLAWKEFPEKFDHGLLLPVEGHRSMAVSLSCDPELKSGERIVMGSDDFESWISIRVFVAPAKSGEPLGAVVLDIVRASETLTEERVRVPFDSHGVAKIGPLSFGSMQASLYVTQKPGNKLAGDMELRHEAEL